MRIKNMRGNSKSDDFLVVIAVLCLKDEMKKINIERRTVTLQPVSKGCSIFLFCRILQGRNKTEK